MTEAKNGDGGGTSSPKYTAQFKQRAEQLYRERDGANAEIDGELGADPCAISDLARGRTL